jgi:hypothetical protein
MNLSGEILNLNLVYACSVQERNKRELLHWSKFKALNDVLLFFLNRLVGSGVQLGPIGTAATDWPIIPAPGDYDDGEFGAMKIDKGNRSTRRKSTPALLCPPEIPLDQTRV